MERQKAKRHDVEIDGDDVETEGGQSFRRRRKVEKVERFEKFEGLNFQSRFDCRLLREGEGKQFKRRCLECFPVGFFTFLRNCYYFSPLLLLTLPRFFIVLNGTYIEYFYFIDIFFSRGKVMNLWLHSKRFSSPQYKVQKLFVFLCFSVGKERERENLTEFHFVSQRFYRAINQPFCSFPH